MTDYIREEKSGILTIVRELTPEDFNVEKPHMDYSQYTNSARVWMRYVFAAPATLSDLEKEIMGFCPYRYNGTNDEEYERTRYNKHISMSEDVRMQGVRKDKQEDKLKAVGRNLLKNLRGIKGQDAVKAEIAKLNDKIAAEVEKRNRQTSENWCRTWSNPHNWEFDGEAKEEMDSIEEQLKNLRALEDALLTRKRKIQKEEITNHIANTNKVHGSVKAAFAEYMETNGLSGSHGLVLR